VLGWSFPRKHVRESPLAQLLAEPLPTPSSPVPRIGLLHGDLGASGGRYAPIRQSELDDAGCDAWLLGHIHKPSLAGASAAPGARPCGYLGSLVGLDPSETGPRGPWLVKLSADGGVEPEHIALAPLRWERIQDAGPAMLRLRDKGLPDGAREAALSEIARRRREGGCPCSVCALSDCSSA